MQCSMIGPSLFQRLEGRFQRFRARCNDFAKRDHGGRNRVDLVGHQAVRRVLDAVEHIVQCRGDVVDVLRVERRDEGLVQAGEDLVNDFVALVLQSVDFGGCAASRALPARTPSSSSREASEMISTCFRNRW